MGASQPDPHRGSAPGPRWVTSVLLTPSMPTPGKNPADAHVESFISETTYHVLKGTLDSAHSVIGAPGMRTKVNQQSQWKPMRTLN